MDFATTCFVIMPFGEKEILDDHGAPKMVDFDAIYTELFEPAIRAVTLPEGSALVPHRTDKDFFSGDISQDMFEYLEYSRFALADITGLNANVMYELGVRHRARQAGTAIFRQVAARIPFDISQIKAFPYEYEPADHAQASRELITRVLAESMQQNRIDSPVQRALLTQRALQQEQEVRTSGTAPDVEAMLRRAENAIRVGDRAQAMKEYQEALAVQPANALLLVRLGLLHKDDGKWGPALALFHRALAVMPDYSDALREKGIAENKLFYKGGGAASGLTDGMESLRAAIALNPDDYDAHSSLGGALKRAGLRADALAAYERAVDVSRGHSYPLLNAIKLRASLTGKLELDGKTQLLLKRAERSLRAQVATDAPYDPPWSFFDLAEIRLFSGDSGEFLSLADRGVEYATQGWQVVTFADSLELLLTAGVDLPGLREGIARLREEASFLD